jgi:hypothetical protein
MDKKSTRQTGRFALPMLPQFNPRKFPSALKLNNCDKEQNYFAACPRPGCGTATTGLRRPLTESLTRCSWWDS